jgi:translation initiation factor IF-2
MPENNTVDDYYSSIHSESLEKKAWNTEPQAKIKAKKIVKKIVKKVEDKIVSSTVSDSSVAKWEEKTKFTRRYDDKAKTGSTKSFVQKMTILKTEKKESTPILKRVERKPNPNYKGNNNAAYKGKTPLSKPSDNNSEDRSKNYWEDKVKGWLKKWERKNYNTSAKKTWWFNKSKTRGRLKFYDKEPVDTSFTRSNKIAKTIKEEKKVEDIKQNLTIRTWETIIVRDIFSLKEFSEKIWIPLVKLIAEFMKNGMMVNINSKIDFDSACIIAESFDIKLERDNSKWVSVKDLMNQDISVLLVEDDSSKLKERPPVISIMGHVDHGKTSLLDCIRKSKITDGEAWGITQSIWAYQVEQNGKKLTFLDTPGHEAFTVMRSRGAKATDIAILVVAADEWVKPQTIESISHAKEAGIPVIVAINKMDKEGANPDHIKWQLAEHGLSPEDWGGDTPMIPVSAKSWFWIEELLEILLLVAEMKELKANPNRTWVATVIESHLDKSLGPVATVLVNTWTVNKWDNIVCNDSFWKIRTMKNFENYGLLKAIPWDPILIIWLDKVVSGWDILQVVANPSIAKSKSLEYSEIISNIKKNEMSGLDVLMSRIKAWNLKQLKILVKADTNWSLEAIKASILKLSTEDTNIVIIHSWVGNITEWDILMVDSSSAILVWFNVDPISNAKSLLEKSSVEYINSKVIYHVTDRIEKIVSWMLDPKEVEVSLWEGKVLAIFYTDKKFLILWIEIKEDNKVEKNCLVRVIRKDKKIWEGKITSLKQWIEEVKEIEWPVECWIRFEWRLDVQEWDKLELYKIEIHK